MYIGIELLRDELSMVALMRVPDKRTQSLVLIPYRPTLPLEEVAAELLNILFGTGSYARKNLEGMGWKERDALGHTAVKGITEPLRATGNKGTAGLGNKRFQEIYISSVVDSLIQET